MFIKLILLSGMVALVGSVPMVLAQPLQGFAEESQTQTRIQRPLDNSFNAPFQINANQDQVNSSLVKLDEFRTRTQSTQQILPTQPIQLPTGSQQIMGSTRAGQNEYWVSWDAWRARIADAVWEPLKQKRTIMWGTTRVDYDVTRDHHIQITSVRTPDPSGKSGNVLAAAIMQLNGSPILTFPPGSKQTIHHNFNMDIGLPIPGRVHHTIHLRGGTEHVINQW